MSSTAIVAGPVTYRIDFTTISGLAPTEGSFTYDDTLSLGNRFTAFQVVWNSMTFDLVTSANAPFINGSDCGTTSNSFISFTLLQGTNQCAAGGEIGWAAAGDDLHQVISIQQVSNLFTNSIHFTGVLDSATVPKNTDLFLAGRGGFVITQVPEPGSIFITLAGCTLLVALRLVQGKYRALPPGS